MTINHVLPSQIRASGVDRQKDSLKSKGTDGSTESPSNSRSDRVEISAEGRILSTANEAQVDGESGLTQEQIALVHQRMDDGTYDSPDVAEEVGRQLLNSGDLHG